MSFDSILQEQPRTSTLSVATQRALGWLLPLTEEPGVRDILVRAESADSCSVWVDAGSGLRRIQAPKIGAAQLRAQAVALLAAGGRQLDELRPLQDAHLGNGIRVHAALSPVAASGHCLSIRVPSKTTLTLENLVAAGSLTAAGHARLAEAIRCRENVLIVGGTGSGKTTLLAALLQQVPESERIITIEDVAELRPGHAHHISLETRVANSEMVGEITLEVLLQNALRMRPDRLVLGECRGPEIATLLSALNTGHDGGAGTLHASTVDDVPARVEALGALAGLAPTAIARQFVSAIDLIVHLERVQSKHRVSKFGVPYLTDAGLLGVRVCVL
ncbi:CpaF family protein [Canibacter zhoujuaniae]|uniref:CpaF family protein n=1 Tax=Canibacter zhoujuaniae TaxID=2708343 RepID=UPI00141E1639|nr:ATPase, T2SS/T4P/T4SS family [Canibacter zhoujuaniae]